MTTYGKGPTALISAMEKSVGVGDKKRIGQVLDVARKLSYFQVSPQGKVMPAKGTPAASRASAARVKRARTLSSGT